MAEIVAKRLVEHLERAGFVVMKRRPDAGGAIRTALLDALDRQRQVDQAARLVARHFRLGHPPEQLIGALALAVLREDAGFHAYQMLEAGVRQIAVWGDTDEGRPAEAPRR